jgi:hypothetical protein
MKISPVKKIERVAVPGGFRSFRSSQHVRHAKNGRCFSSRLSAGGTQPAIADPFKATLF